MLVNVSPAETRVAVVDGGILQDLYIERTTNRSLVGNIYRGKVLRVLPGMQAAFVDFGEQQAGFLHAADLAGLDRDGREEDAGQALDIAGSLREGQQILVQVLKEPISDKGARLGMRLSFAARNLVYTPQASHIGISRQIDSDDERSRLRDVLDRARNVREMQGGFILRTAAEDASSEEIEADLDFLQGLWSVTKNNFDQQSGPGLVHEDLQLLRRAIRDFARPGLTKIRLDDRPAYEGLKEFCAACMPGLSPLLEYQLPQPALFDLYGLEGQIEQALASRVDLQSGGYLLIEQTEAMTTIDVNTGSFVGVNDADETIYRTNMEAASVLARELRVRNLGGIIIVDFIDMRDEAHRRGLLAELEAALARDSAHTIVSEVSGLGLVQLTRQRKRESLEQTLCETCPSCSGRGSIKSVQTVCNEIFRDILRHGRSAGAGGLLVLASPVVLDSLRDEEATVIVELEAFVEKSIQFREEPDYSREQFDIILL
jgi:ribonuclease G